MECSFGVVDEWCRLVPSVVAEGLGRTGEITGIVGADHQR
jgi:hypothetical protein